MGYGGGGAGGVWSVVTLKLYLFISDQLRMSDATVRVCSSLWTSAGAGPSSCCPVIQKLHKRCRLSANACSAACRHAKIFDRGLWHAVESLCPPQRRRQRTKPSHCHHVPLGTTRPERLQRRDREPEQERRARRRRTLHGQVAPHLPREPPADRQPEPGPLDGAASLTADLDEGLEDRRVMVGRDAAARVLHAHRDPRARPPRAGRRRGAARSPPR